MDSGKRDTNINRNGYNYRNKIIVLSVHVTGFFTKPTWGYVIKSYSQRLMAGNKEK